MGRKGGSESIARQQCCRCLYHRGKLNHFIYKILPDIVPSSDELLSARTFPVTQYVNFSLIIFHSLEEQLVTLKACLLLKLFDSFNFVLVETTSVLSMLV